MLLPSSTFLALLSLSVTVLQPAFADTSVLGVRDELTPAVHDENPNVGLIQPRQVSRPKWLRVLPLGASIVQGQNSNPQDGFRKPVRDSLRASGHKVNMVGTRNNDHLDPPGSMRDGAHEGVPGQVIEEIAKRVDNAMKFKPNLVLINAGTNNAIQNRDVATAHEQLSDMMDNILRQSPRAAIILSTVIINAKNAAANANVDIINAKIRTMVGRRHALGDPIFLAEMNNGTFITASDLGSDGIHPTNDGYRKVAAVFDAAIIRAALEGRLQKPEDVADFADDSLDDGDDVELSSPSPSSLLSMLENGGVALGSNSSQAGTLVSENDEILQDDNTSQVKTMVG